MADKARRVAIYARVSTDGQTVDNQLVELRHVADRHGWDVVSTHVDEGVSGAKERERRPGFDALCTAVARREVDMVAKSPLGEVHQKNLTLIHYLAQMKRLLRCGENTTENRVGEKRGDLALDRGDGFGPVAGSIFRVFMNPEIFHRLVPNVLDDLFPIGRVPEEAQQVGQIRLRLVQHGQQRVAQYVFEALPPGFLAPELMKCLQDSGRSQ